MSSKRPGGPTKPKSFRRSWSTKNLHDRALKQDVTGMYDLSRIASLTAHGSAGATIHDKHTDGVGTRSGSGRPTHAHSKDS